MLGLDRLPVLLLLGLGLRLQVRFAPRRRRPRAAEGGAGVDGADVPADAVTVVPEAPCSVGSKATLAPPSCSVIIFTRSGFRMSPVTFAVFLISWASLSRCGACTAHHPFKSAFFISFIVASEDPCFSKICCTMAARSASDALAETVFAISLTAVVNAAFFAFAAFFNRLFLMIFVWVFLSHDLAASSMDRSVTGAILFFHSPFVIPGVA